MEFKKLDDIKENNIYCSCNSDTMNKIEFCKSYNPNIIDVEYIKKCLERVSIEIQSYDEKMRFYVYCGIEGLNEEDFLADHMLDAFIFDEDNYKIEFHVA